ncbi:MAG TPA: cbb3-type cytochrome c oxidase subunit II, partial [Oligoflexia bacterium]|nr:cbb3-type cytochrome c oxidase subunit II [Oligoflexia bacterium]
AYPWLEQRDLDTSLTQKKLSVLRRMGAPYAPEVNAAGELQSQAQSIVGELQKQGAPVAAETARKEIIALIAYLQRLGTDIKRGMQ